jgi:hypothetical protein
VPLVEQELLTLPEHLSSPRFFVGFVLLYLVKMTRKEEFEDTKGVIRIRISKKDTQHNGVLSHSDKLNVIPNSLNFPVNVP